MRYAAKLCITLQTRLFMIDDGEFPGRVHFIAHAVRDIADRLAYVRPNSGAIGCNTKMPSIGSRGPGLMYTAHRMRGMNLMRGCLAHGSIAVSFRTSGRSISYGNLWKSPRQWNLSRPLLCDLRRLLTQTFWLRRTFLTGWYEVTKKVGMCSGGAIPPRGFSKLQRRLVAMLKRPQSASLTISADEVSRNSESY